jgi:hypothetical protein
MRLEESKRDKKSGRTFSASVQEDEKGREQKKKKCGVLPLSDCDHNGKQCNSKP